MDAGEILFFEGGVDKIHFDLGWIIFEFFVGVEGFGFGGLNFFIHGLFECREGLGMNQELTLGEKHT